MRSEAVGNVCEDFHPVFELNPKHAVWEGLDHHPVNEVWRPGHER